jgi:CubicO group peptidase (beta-lactamase class C family)
VDDGTVRDLEAVVRAAADDGFTGAVRVDVAGEVVHASAHGHADRAHGIENTVATRFAAASATKGCTALVVLRLVELGALALTTTVRSILGSELPHVHPAVTVQHLLAHRSGIGEYCYEADDQSPDRPAIDVAQCQIERPAAILPLLRDQAMRAEPDAEFRYNNAGYVLLALIAERVAGDPIAELIQRLVLDPAEMDRTAMLAYDELPGDAAIGYVDRVGERTNVHQVPNRGVGDGGLFTTTEDVARLWRALLGGAIVRPDTLESMTRPYGWTPSGTPYGMGFWLDPHTDAIKLEGADVGISFRSVHRPSTRVTWTVVSNWTDGAWPLARELARVLQTSGEAADV